MTQTGKLIIGLQLDLKNEGERLPGRISISLQKTEIFYCGEKKLGVNSGAPLAK